MDTKNKTSNENFNATSHKTDVIRRFSTSLVWYHRSEMMPNIGHRILVFSPYYDDRDPMKIRLIDSQFYKMSIDAEYWAYVNTP